MEEQIEPVLLPPPEGDEYWNIFLTPEELQAKLEEEESNTNTERNANC